MRRSDTPRLLLAAAMLLVTCSCSLPRPQEVRVLAAASLADLMADLTPVARRYGLALRCTFGASSQVRAQVEAGAPTDLLLSASADDAQALQTRGFASARDCTPIYRNHLVLVAPADGWVRTVDDLRTRGRVGIGDPRTVPSGRYAEASLRRIGLWDALEGRRVHGTDARVVLGWVARGEVDAAVIYATDQQAEASRLHLVMALPDDSHPPIVYVAVIPKQATNRSGAEVFVQMAGLGEGVRVARLRGFDPVMQGRP